MFGNYINKGEFIFYPFYEYYYDQDAEYKPQELGYDVNIDYRGKYRAHEGLLFFAYGFTDRLAIEFEMAFISAEQQKSAGDISAMPKKLTESGLGDVEGQIRWRWNRETASKPEFFSYYETVFPLQQDKYLIGTKDWEFKLGHGLIKGFAWGTMTLRAAIEYDASENKTELGEYAVEYLKRISSRSQIYLGVEGTQDELELITDLQFKILSKTFLRINNAFGISSKATDYAPELGLLFRL
ncbi:MAG: hypothetical protein DWQ10_13540 [Calditrichaeota bacterium]|nr:MAG: hypothetical protein DWQ10_13540 [Calditrichota bacterium]